MKESRTRIWIDPFQTKLFWRVAVYWLVYTVTLFNFLFAWRLLTDGSEDLLQKLSATAYDNVPLFFCFLLVAPWIGLDSVRFANRLVGPLYRFRKTMQSVTAGEEIRLIKLRQGDFLLEMQDDFNAMLRALQERDAVQLSDGTVTTSNMGR